MVKAGQGSGEGEAGGGSPPPSPLARTALLTAAARALETERADALFRDPWARRLAGADGAALLARTESERPARALAVRTRFFDDALAGAFARGVRRVVVLGAGFDMRPHRLGPPDVDWLLVDDAAVHDEKAARLGDEAPHVGRARRLDADVRDAALPAAALVARAPSVVLAEGLLMYLAHDEAEALVARWAEALAPGSLFAFDAPSPKALDRAGPMERHHRELDAAGARWRFAHAAPAELFRGAGESSYTVAVTELGVPSAHYGRLLEPPHAAGEAERRAAATTWFVVAARER